MPSTTDTTNTDASSVRERPYKRLGTSRSRGDLRSEILYAVREAMRNGSYDTLTIEQVAAKTGVSRRTLYNLFQDKDDIYRQSCESLIRSVADLVIEEIPERMSTIDGLGFYIAACTEVYGSAAAKDLLRSVARDGAHQPWLVSGYYRHVREPLVRACELFLLKKSRRVPLSLDAPRHIGAQIADIVQSITVVPMIFNRDDAASGVLPQQMEMIARAYAGVVEGNVSKV